MKASDAETKSI